MLNAKQEPNGDIVFSTIEIEEIATAITLFAPLLSRFTKDVFIDYSTGHAAAAYQESELAFIQTANGQIAAPYQLIYDYRKWPARKRPWGTVEFSNDYILPSALRAHYDEMTQEFIKKGKLVKGNQPLPRLKRYEFINDVPHFVLQKAHYFDQVGSNLTLDRKLSHSISANGIQCETVREWDVVQSHGTAKVLPTFEESKLANTIGVAVGITAKSEDGRTQWLRRMRTKNVAVYSGMWHLPFSFALSLLDESMNARDLNTLIHFDQGSELSEELNLEPSNFHPLRPLAFCRDLARGGKPQFFFELQAIPTFDQLEKKIKDHTKEYLGGIETITESERTSPSPDMKFSPELICFLLLKLQEV